MTNMSIKQRYDAWMTDMSTKQRYDAWMTNMSIKQRYGAWMTDMSIKQRMCNGGHVYMSCFTSHIFLVYCTLDMSRHSHDKHLKSIFFFITPSYLD